MTRILQLPELNGSHGRFGNMLIWYGLGRWLCEKYGATLQTPQWPGEQVFQIDDPPIEGAPCVLLSWPFSPEMEVWEGRAILNTAEYSFPTDFSNEDFWRWLPFRKEFEYPHEFKEYACAIHVRRGDFLLSDKWPIVAESAMLKAARDAGREHVTIVSEEAPHRNPNHPAKLGWLEDFLILCHAKTLFVYPASSFSGCAARFNTGTVYIPHDYHNGPTECRWEKRQPQTTKT